MPIYEYRCEGCGERFEKLARMSTEDKEIQCPSCGERRSRKQLSTFATGGSASAGASGGRCGPPGSGFT